MLFRVSGETLCFLCAALSRRIPAASWENVFADGLAYAIFRGTHREVSAVALDSIYEFRAVQLSMLTAAVTLVAKSGLAIVYMFSRRWKPVIWLRYGKRACLGA